MSEQRAVDGHRMRAVSCGLPETACGASGAGVAHGALMTEATHPAVRTAPPERWRFSNGEVHYLWWFIQGSIMVPDIRWRLRRAWGLCDRHAWGALLGEASYRHGYLHGPTRLYEDLLGRAVTALDVQGPWKTRRVARRLRPTGPCLMCELALENRGPGAARLEVLRAGRDPRALQGFAARTRPYWDGTVCGRCAGRRTDVRCRIHLGEDIRRGARVHVGTHRAFLVGILNHLLAYSRSFVWGHHGTATEEDQAALISAIGWCSGWRGLLAVLATDGA